MKVHYVADYLIDPPHPITVNLIGIGGTGSQVLSHLARINEALCSRNHPGLKVFAYDPDIVSEANIGRQLFSPADIGLNKASVMITRMNRFFGYNWLAYPKAFDSTDAPANITISCVDTVKARVSILEAIRYSEKQKALFHGRGKYYWMDFGNSYSTGQVILGTLLEVPQPKESQYETVAKLPNVFHALPGLNDMEDKDEGPSCSLAQALGRQDLFINTTLANYGCNMLWKLLSDFRITYRGFYLNLATMQTNPIKL